MEKLPLFQQLYGRLFFQTERLKKPPYDGAGRELTR